jgi:amino acid transporter
MLVVTPSLNSVGFVFTEAAINTPSETTGYLLATGMLSILFSFSGYEASGHMAEETTDSVKAAPRGLIRTCVATALAGSVFFSQCFSQCKVFSF